MTKIGATAGLVALALTNASGQLQIRPLLDDLQGQVLSADVSNDGKILAFEWCLPNFEGCGIYTRPVAGGPMKLLVGRAGVGMPSWSPDGKMIAFTDTHDRWDIRLVVRDLASGVERELGGFCNARGGESPPSWSPDSHWIAANRNMGDMACAPALFPADGSQPIRNLAERGSSPVFAPRGAANPGRSRLSSRLSPDSRLLAYAENRSLKLLPLSADYRPAAPAATLVEESRPIVGITWTRDGKGILYEILGDSPSSSWQVYLRRIAPQPGAKPRPVPDLPNRLSISSMFESTDAGTLALVTQPPETSWDRFDLQTPPMKIEAVSEPGCSDGNPLDTFGPYIPPWPWGSCSPDGRQRALISTQTGLAEIHVANADGSEDRVLVKAGDGWNVDEVPRLAGWSPDGKWIAVIVQPLFADHGSGYANLYIVPAFGGPARLLARNIDEFAWSPDSQLVVASADASGPLVRVDSEGKTTQLGVSGFSPKIPPDGQWLYFLSGPWQKSELARVPMKGGAVESLDETDRALFLVGNKYLYVFRQRQIPSGAVMEEIFRMDPRTHVRSAIGEVPSFSHAWLSRDERYLYFPNQKIPKPRLVLIDGL